MRPAGVVAAAPFKPGAVRRGCRVGLSRGGAGAAQWFGGVTGTPRCAWGSGRPGAALETVGKSHSCHVWSSVTCCHPAGEGEETFPAVPVRPRRWSRCVVCKSCLSVSVFLWLISSWCSQACQHTHNVPSARAGTGVTARGAMPRGCGEGCAFLWRGFGFTRVEVGRTGRHRGRWRRILTR